MTNYVDRCLCGYFVTQEEIDTGYCPECYCLISNLNKRWTQYEQLHSEEISLAPKELEDIFGSEFCQQYQQLSSEETGFDDFDAEI